MKNKDKELLLMSQIINKIVQLTNEKSVPLVCG